MAPPRYAPYVPRMRPASRTPMECSRCRAICWREPSPHTCAGERAVVSLAPAVLVVSAGERAVVSLAPAVPVASAQPERSLCWQRLPCSAAAAFRSASVCTVQKLMDLSTVALDQLVAESSALRSCKSLLECLRSEPFDRSLFLQRLMAAPRLGRGISVHDALRVTQEGGSALPRPRESLRALADAKRDGRDVTSLLDSVVDLRAGCAIAESTGRTYDSLMNQVR